MTSSSPAGERALSTWGSGASPSGATLSDGVVLKPGGPWSAAVIALLRHLDEVGFSGAPKVVGDGCAADGRMTLGYVPGDSPHPHAWSDAQVGKVGELLRRLHDATASFSPPGDAHWQQTWLRELQGDEWVVGHCDTAPWNIVGRGGAPEAFVDWEFAGPVDRITEVAHTAWLNSQLHDDDVAELQGLPDARTRASHFRSILEGYGLAAGRRREVVDRMIELAVHSARAEAVMARVTPESEEAVGADGYPVLWAITWRARSASWMMRHRTLLLTG